MAPIYLGAFILHKNALRNLVNVTNLKFPIDFMSHVKYNIGVTESEVLNLSPRTGRPKAENPKSIRFSIRLDDETEKKLQEYCTSNGITKGEAIRQGIHLLLDKKR